METIGHALNHFDLVVDPLQLSRVNGPASMIDEPFPVMIEGLEQT
jgi:hypothetical protein